METEVPTWRTMLLPLTFALACLVIAIGLWKSFGGDLPLDASPYQVRVDVPSADALYSNSDVRMAGVSVGKVRKVERKGSVAELTLGIDPDFAPIGRGAQVTVRNKSLLGEGYLEIAPGDAQAPKLPDRGRLASSNVRPTQRLDDVLQTFSPSARASFRKMTQGVDGAFRGRASDVNDLLGRTPALTGNLEQVIDTFHDQTQPLQSLISNADTVFAAVGSRDRDLREAIVQGNRLAETTASRDGALRDTISALPPFLTRLQGAATELAGASGDINRGVNSLRPTVPLIRPALETINARLPAFSNILQRLRPTLRTANRSLPSATRTLNEIGPPLKDVHRSLREFNPFVRFASANSQSIVAFTSNVAALMNATEITGGGFRQHTASAVLSVWNEIIGGYVKRLPTNTSNVYPRPGSTYDLKKNGTLSAYDCRNVNNPLIVPPTGGTPPCKQAKAYNYNGRTAQFPRLLLDPP